ncbi:MAG: hypothetical protein WAP52_00380 [Candidatus Sungiibacteriota bacterium]
MRHLDIVQRVLSKKPIGDLFLVSDDPEKTLDNLLETMEGMSDDPNILDIVEHAYRGPFTFQPVSIGNETRRITCRNRFGIPAGLLKEPSGMELLDAMGVGSIELGSVVPEKQDGNPKQRFFVTYDRQRKVWIVRNAFGFNSSGVKSVVRQVRRLFDANGMDTIGASLFWSLSPNKTTMDQYMIGHDLTLIADDILYCVAHILPTLRENDALQFNIASPNTPHLRELFLHFRELLALIIDGARRIAKLLRLPSPSWIIKLSPDMSLEQMRQIMKASCLFEEVIALEGFNSTVDEEIWRRYDIAPGPGGISGDPLCESSHDKLEALYQVAQTENCDIDFISVGGIQEPAEAMRRFEIGPRVKQVQSLSGILDVGFTLIPDTLQLIMDMAV